MHGMWEEQRDTSPFLLVGAIHEPKEGAQEDRHFLRVSSMCGPWRGQQDTSPLLLVPLMSSKEEDNKPLAMLQCYVQAICRTIRCQFLSVSQFHLQVPGRITRSRAHCVCWHHAWDTERTAKHQLLPVGGPHWPQGGEK